MSLTPFICRMSSVWKYTLLIFLLLLLLGSLLVYTYVQKQSTLFLEQEYRDHWATMEAFRQRIMSYFSSSRSEWDSEAMFREVSQIFQEAPELFRVSILDADGTLILGRERREVSEYAQRFFSDSPQQNRRAFGPSPTAGAGVKQTHCVQLPLRIDEQTRGFLRGEFWGSGMNIKYVHLARATLYLLITTSTLMVLSGIFAIFTRVIRHLSAKQTQLETYALSLEKTNETLRKTQKELHVSEKLASLGYLAAGIAHEIGNPLGAVLGYVELLQKGKLSQPQNQDILQRIEQETERIRNIIQELVNFSRPHSMHLRRVDINQLIKKTVARLPFVKQNQIQIELHLTAYPLVAEIDGHKLQSVFLNIIGNSLDALTENGGGNIWISTCKTLQKTSSLGKESEVISIKFSDTGCGISEDDLARIFDPFFTTKDPGNGMGLGLSLCHRIIDSLHGTIEVKSTVGEGTDVYILLPPALDSSQNVAHQEDVSEPSGSISRCN